MQIGVVGAVETGGEGGVILALQLERVVDRRVDLQEARRLAVGVVHAVIEDGGDILALRVVVDGLLLDHGGHGDDLGETVAGLLDIRLHLLADLHLEGVEQCVDGEDGLAGVELVRIGVEEALHAADVAELARIEERVVLKRIVRAGVRQLLDRADALAREQLDRLLHGVALRDGDFDLSLLLELRGLIVVHAADERAVVHVARQLIAAGVDELFVARDVGVELEEPLVVDEPLLLELSGDLPERLALRDLNGDGDVLLVQRAQVVCQQPAETRQHDRAEHDAGDIDAPVELFVFAAAVLRALFPLAADLVRVPVGGFKLFGHE